MVCYSAIQLIKNRLKIDDSLDVFAVHGVGGMLGSLLLAVFMAAVARRRRLCRGHDHGRDASACRRSASARSRSGRRSSPRSCALAVSLFLPMRVSEDDERQGLDIASHGERGWEFD